MASVRQKNGKWYYRITLTVGDGSHKYIERGSWTSKKEALEAGKEAEKLLKHGDMDERRKNLSFSFLSEEWLSTCDKRYKPRSIMHYKEMLNGGDIANYIFISVTEGKSYATLNPPCGKEYFYKKYRQFFWLLDKELS